MPYLPPVPSVEVVRYLKGGNGVDHDSAALLSDGRVIYQYGTDMMTCWYQDARAFTQARNNLATTPYSQRTAIGSGYLGPTPRTTLFRGGVNGDTGGLYMSILGVWGGSRSARIYESPSGTGESAPGVPDWTLSSTVWSDGGNYEGPFTNSSRVMCGRPAFIGARWALPIAYNQSTDDVKSAVYTSENGAAGPWTFKVWIGHYILGGAYGYGQSRQIVSTDGGTTLVTGSTGNVDGSRSMVSFDGGVTWQGNFDFGGNFPWQWGGNSATNDPIFYHDGYIYRIVGNAPPGLYSTDFGADLARSTGDIVHGAYELMLQVDNFIGASFGFVHQLSIPFGIRSNGAPKFAVIRNGRILHAGGQTWWIRTTGF